VIDVDAHLVAFNAAVRRGDWSAFADRFADDAELVFVAVPIGPFRGRAAIEAAYLANPPDDTLTRVAEPEPDGDEQVVRFRWDRTGDTGTMRFVWAPDRRVGRLVVSFD
jgi:steroid delta-isomerase